MLFKYIIKKDSEKNTINIEEFGETDDDVFHLLCQESYDASIIFSCISNGSKNILDLIRTDNLYPPEPCALKITQAITEMYEEGAIEKEALFDDKEVEGIKNSEKEVEESEEEEEELLNDIEKNSGEEFKAVLDSDLDLDLKSED